MIIRLTFVDNDFTQYLEEFCEGLRDRMFAFEEKWPECTEFSSVDEYSKAWITFLDAKKEADNTRRRLMKPDNRFTKQSKEYRQICNEVIRLWNKFAPSVDMERWTPDVSIQYSLNEECENGEVVYYFTPYDKWITQ